MTIDCHTHLYPQAYLERVGRLINEPGDVGSTARATVKHPVITRDSMFTGDLDERVGMMDAAGIDLQILSMGASNVWHPVPSTRHELVRAFNDGCLEAAERHPGRFAVFANAPLPHVEATLAETERLASHPNVVGVSMCTHVANTTVDDPGFRPVYEDWNARQLCVFLHPSGFCVKGPLDDYAMDISLGMVFDDTVAAVRLIQSGMVMEYPDITWMVSHVGGVLPFVLGRVDRIWGGANPANRGILPRAPSTFLDTMLFDTVTLQAGSIRLAADTLGVERLVYGSDFPFWSRHELAFGQELLELAGLTLPEQEMVRRTNIARRLTLPTRTGPGVSSG